MFKQRYPTIVGKKTNAQVELLKKTKENVYTLRENKL